MAFLLVISAALAPAAELRFSLTGDPRTFDALKVSDQRSELIRYLTGGVLVRVNRVTDKPEPELAESWKLSDRGRTITFRLRAGLKFSDGSPLTAADVARTFTAALDPKNAAPVGDTFRSEQGDPEVRVVSPLEVAIRYPQPKPDIDRLFDSLSILPAAPTALPASAGPFFVAEYKAGDYVRLARNPHYWKRDAAGKQLPYLDSIRIDIQPNREIELTRFLR
ncbi:MAG TPA: ABC transporter substrate-binding protein, partial [Bryobacteraceae bacterium]|nr:ABC transporter substrate-binding protein [Bryobacteraceae bacterium]